MGLLDFPAPLFAWIDRAAASVMPPALVLLVWAALGAAISMELYRLLSPEMRVARLKSDLRSAQLELARYDGPFEGAWPLIRRMLRLAFTRVGTVLPASLGASLPLLVLIVWLDGAYARMFPPIGSDVAVMTIPSDLSGRLEANQMPPRLVVTDNNGMTVADVPVQAPIPVLHKWRWWNALIGNPAGYLDPQVPIERVDVELPRQQVIQVGPDWARRWEAVFFPVLVILAFGLKIARRIE